MKMTINDYAPITDIKFIDTKVVARITKNALSYCLDVGSLYFGMAINPNYEFQNGALKFIKDFDSETSLYHLDISDISDNSHTDKIASIVKRDDIAIVQYASANKTFCVQFKYACGGIMNEDIAAEIKVYIQNINMKNYVNQTTLLAFSNDLDSAALNERLVFDFGNIDTSDDDCSNFIYIKLDDDECFNVISDFLSQNLDSAYKRNHWKKVRETIRDIRIERDRQILIIMKKLVMG